MAVYLYPRTGFGETYTPPSNADMQTAGEDAAYDAISNGKAPTKDQTLAIMEAAALLIPPPWGETIAGALWLLNKVGVVDAVVDLYNKIFANQHDHYQQCADKLKNGTIPKLPGDPGWISWASVHGDTTAPRGSFREFAGPIFALNDELWMNCHPQIPWRALVKHVIDQWNNSHGGPSVPTAAPAISIDVYQGRVTGGHADPTGADIVAFALGKVQEEIAADPDPNSPLTRFFNVTAFHTIDQQLQVAVNNGPAFRKLIHPLPKGFSLGSPAAGTSTATKIVATTAAVGGAAFLGAAVVAWAKGRTIGWVFDRSWAKIKGGFRR